MRIFCFIICLGLLTALFPQQAEAQRARQNRDTPFVADVLSGKTTEAILPDTIEILSFPKMSFGESNKYFNDITTIQYQISLLNVLVERQRKNKEIQTAMNGIGIVYKEPAPMRSTCMELPRNKLCEKFYPEIYGLNLPPVSIPPVDMGFQDFINQRTLPEGQTPVTTKRDPVKPKPTTYLWADITCIFDTCRAVLIPASGGSRFSVKVADEVGTKYVVGHISAGKVALIEKETGKTIDLQPAPSSASGGSASPFITVSTSQMLGTANADSIDDLIDTLKSDPQIEIVQ